MLPVRSRANPRIGGVVSSKTPARLDDVDRSIIRVLQRNGRTNNSEIGRELGLAETTIRKRIARLIEDDLLTVVAVPTPLAVSAMTSAIIGVSVELCKLHEVTEALVACPEVRYVGLSTGRYDLIIEAFFPDQERVLEFLSHKLGSFEGVTGVETSLILKIAKFSYEWELP